MEKFHFEALDKNGKTLSGSIFGESEGDVRAKLQKNGLAVLSIVEFNKRVQTDSDKKIFEFLAVDIEGKDINGTIQSQDMYGAYKKLILDYKYKIKYLIPGDISESQKNILKLNGVDPELKKRFIQEKLKTKDTIEQGDFVTEKAVGKRQKEMDFLRKEIDKIVFEVKKLVAENEQFIDSSKKRDVIDRINLLSRLKRSNSIEHLGTLTKKLLASMKDDKLFLQNLDLDAQSQKDYDTRKTRLKKSTERLETSFNEGFAKLQLDISGLNTEKLKKTLIKLNPIEKFFWVIYWTSVFLFSMLGIFWIWNIIKIFMGIFAEKSFFHFNSGTLWYFTIASAIVAGFLSVEMFTERLSWKKRAILFSSAFATLLFFTFEFPAIFFWTN
ncbi:MAG: hypothetical protein OEL89_05110 [Candidatus Peregrinibacteria bacterium]|nr:hypothetical protein [Candidatus Peregrinibacteria bacterium]